MMPWLQAYQWAMDHGVTPQEWEEKIHRCMTTGLLISTTEGFVAAYPTEHLGEAAYFVVMAFGGSGHPLRRFLWSRRNEKRVRAYRWEQLAKKAGI
jgi:hypothetical protein